MSIDRERQATAANRLEELAIVLKEHIRLLRDGQHDDLAYALIYWLRREIGQVVATLGQDAPRKQYMDRAQAIFESQSHDCGHPSWGNSGRCAEMSCSNYVNKHVRSSVPGLPDLVEGQKYWIRYQSETQRVARTAVMRYLSRPDENNTTWSARPTAGTQQMPDRWVLEVREIPESTTCYVGRVLRPW